MESVDVFNIQPSAKQRKRNNFNVSYHNYFTCKVGQLVPSYFQEMRGGDYIEITPTNFTRTQPLKTSAFTQIREYTDFFFVPYRLLWKWWTQFETQLDNQVSSYQPAKLSAYTVPMVDFSALRALLISAKDGSSSQDIQFWTQACRLLDMCDIFSLDDTKGAETQLQEGLIKNFNPFRLAAYQCVWNNCYRNSYWSSKSIKSCNLDDIPIGGLISDTERLKQLLTLRSVCWYKDMATAVIPTNMTPSQAGVFLAPNAFDDLATTNKVLSRSTSDNSGGSGYIFQPNSGSSGDPLSYGYVNLPEGAFDNKVITPDTIRMALAFDNYCRKRAMANKDIVGQLSAVMGEQEESRFYYPDRLGSFVSDVNIGEVTATTSGSAGDSSNVLGQIAGKGIGSRQGDTIKFSAKEDGIVIGVHYIIPTAQYNGIFDPFNYKSKLYDYYSPEFDGLGFQGQSVSILGTRNPGVGTDPIYGFVPRYMEYKSRLNTLHNQLCIDRSLSSWCSPRTYNDKSNISSLMYVPQNALDSIFGVASNLYSNTDQFICHFNYNAVKASDMTRLGTDFTL